MFTMRVMSEKDKCYIWIEEDKWKKGTLQKLMNEWIEALYCAKNMLDDPLAWKKRERKAETISLGTLGKTFSV